MAESLNLTLKIWRQPNPETKGHLEIYKVAGIDPDASFLEMLDILNEQLIVEGRSPVAFDNDCREGICGCCGAVVNGRPHGPQKETTLCQLHMRIFKNNDTLVIEPFRAKAFPVVRDLVIDRSAFERILTQGGYISVKAGSAPEANSILIKKENSDLAMDAAQCIGCAACAAACPNRAAMLFLSAKVSQLAYLPQGDPEREKRVTEMVHQMDTEGFGNCSNEYECVRVCPKGIGAEHISRMNREYLRALLRP